MGDEEGQEGGEGGQVLFCFACGLGENSIPFST